MSPQAPLRHCPQCRQRIGWRGLLARPHVNMGSLNCPHCQTALRWGFWPSCVTFQLVSVITVTLLFVVIMLAQTSPWWWLAVAALSLSSPVGLSLRCVLATVFRLQHDRRTPEQRAFETYLITGITLVLLLGLATWLLIF